MTLQITIKKSDALALLNRNLDRHILDYQKQIEGWREETSKFSTLILAWSKDQKGVKPEEPDMPRDFRAEYERMAAAIALHSEETLPIGQAEIDQIIHDKWGWKHVFSAQNATYTGSPLAGYENV